MYVKDQEYPPGIHPVGYVNPFPNWLAPALLIAAAAVLLGWMPNPFGEKRRNPAKRRRKNQGRRHVPRRARTRKWMQKAVKRPGALRAWVKRTYGDAGFDSNGRIKMSILRKHYHDSGKLGKRVRLAATFRGGIR